MRPLNRGDQISGVIRDQERRHGDCGEDADDLEAKVSVGIPVLFIIAIEEPGHD